MSLRGEAFLCIWNDHDPEQTAEYEAWHTFEHVPKRVCVPGFLAGRRYADYERDEGRYFTLYDITSLEVLNTPAYRDLQENPTPWSCKMRRAFRNFQRIPCLTLASEGNGCAGAIGSVVFAASRGQTLAIGNLKQRLGSMLSTHEITAYHLGVASSIPAYTVFGISEIQDNTKESFVVIIEGVQKKQTQAAIMKIALLIQEDFKQSAVERCETYDLLFQIQVEELDKSTLRRQLQVQPFAG